MNPKPTSQSEMIKSTTRKKWIEQKEGKKKLQKSIQFCLLLRRVFLFYAFWFFFAASVSVPIWISEWFRFEFWSGFLFSFSFFEFLWVLDLFDYEWRTVMKMDDSGFWVCFSDFGFLMVFVVWWWGLVEYVFFVSGFGLRFVVSGLSEMMMMMVGDEQWWYCLWFFVMILIIWFFWFFDFWFWWFAAEADLRFFSVLGNSAINAYILCQT
jgi:hypothetical protein